MDRIIQDYIITYCFHGDITGAAVEPKDCIIASPYESRYVRAYLEHRIAERRSCASNLTTTAGQEVHMVNLVELSKSSIPTPFEVSVTVKPHQNRGGSNVRAAGRGQK